MNNNGFRSKIELSANPEFDDNVTLDQAVWIKYGSYYLVFSLKPVPIDPKDLSKLPSDKAQEILARMVPAFDCFIISEDKSEAVIGKDAVPSGQILRENIDNQTLRDRLVNNLGLDYHYVPMIFEQSVSVRLKGEEPFTIVTNPVKSNDEYKRFSHYHVSLSHNSEPQAEKAIA